MVRAPKTSHVMDFRVAGQRLALATRISLAAVLVASHFTTTSPYVYPHYVLIILLHRYGLSRYFGVRLRPWQSVYISVAVFLHPMGGLYGWYGSVWWFDHLTHTASATLVAAIGFTVARAHRTRAGVHHWFVPGFTIAFVMAAGHLWEVIETYTPLLTVYGPNDTLWDYVFDFVGGLLVVTFGDRLLSNPPAQLAERVEALDDDHPLVALVGSGEPR